MSDAVKSEIKRLENERCRAVMARDLTALAALVDDDIVHIHASGRIDTKAEYLSGVEKRFVFRDVARQDLTVRVYGDVAVATGGLTQTVEIVGIPKKREMKAVVTQVWGRRDGAWRQSDQADQRLSRVLPQTELAEILKRAGALSPLLRERAPQGDALRRLPDQAAADMVASKLLRLCQPARFGGSEQGIDVLCETLIELGRGDGSQAWVASVYGAMAFQTALFEDKAQHDVWDGDLNSIIAGSLVPVGNRVETAEGGYRLSGRWPFNSGAHHAHWLILGDMADVGTGKPEHAYFLVPAGDYRIDDDWFAVGLAGTGSSTVTLDEVFVPSHRMLLNRDMNEGKAPGTRVNTSPFYRMPLFGYLQLVLASVPVGVAAGMVDDFKTFLRAKSGGPGPVVGIDLLYTRLAEAAAESHAAALLIREAARRVMKKLADGGMLDDADAGLAMRDSGYALRLAKRAATQVFEATGAHGLYLSNAIQRGHRDIHAAGNHGSLTWERSALRYAQTAMKD